MRCPLEFFSGQVRACCMCSVPQNQASIRKMPVSHCTISGFVVIEIQRTIERWSGYVRDVLQRLVKILSFQNVALPNKVNQINTSRGLIKSIYQTHNIRHGTKCHVFCAMLECCTKKIRMAPLPLCLHESFVCEQSLDSD